MIDLVLPCAPSIFSCAVPLFGYPKDEDHNERQRWQSPPNTAAPFVLAQQRLASTQQEHRSIHWVSSASAASSPLVSASPTIRFHGPTPPTPPRPLPDPRLGVPPVLPRSVLPHAYVAYKSGGLTKSKGGSMIPPSKRYSHSFACRGIPNVSVLVVLILALLYLFIFYPVLTFYRDEKRNDAIQGNVKVNATAMCCFSFLSC